MVKRRKQRTAKKELNKSETEEQFDANAFHGYIPATLAIELGSDNETSILNRNKLTTSDSDFSDNDATRGLKMKKYEETIRQSALSLFFSIIKVQDLYILNLFFFVPPSLNFPLYDSLPKFL